MGFGSGQVSWETGRSWFTAAPWRTRSCGRTSSRSWKALASLEISAVREQSTISGRRWSDWEPGPRTGPVDARVSSARATAATAVGEDRADTRADRRGVRRRVLSARGRCGRPTRVPHPVSLPCVPSTLGRMLPYARPSASRRPSRHSTYSPSRDRLRGRAPERRPGARLGPIEGPRSALREFP